MHTIAADWPAPPRVRAACTTRQGGISSAPWCSLNLGDHVFDQPSAVAENRRRLVEQAGLPMAPRWLEQVHGNAVATLHQGCLDRQQADAIYSAGPGQVCAVMTADCLPVLFCDAQGREVAAAHAGWRGLCGGVLEATLSRFQAPSARIMAWLGPAIGAQAFEVGAEVKAAFTQQHAAAAHAFTAHGDKFLADIYALARLRLRAAGVTQIYGGDFCTYRDSERFFSYRRDGLTGRMASFIWLI